MEQKNRLVFVIIVTVLIGIAMFTSFGRSLFSGKTAEIVLPPPEASQGENTQMPSPETSTQQYPRVEVDKNTVQSVIASLNRSGSYYRELTVEQFWGEEQSSLTAVQVWVDEEWSHVSQVLPSGLIRHDLVGKDTLYYWYEGDDNWLTAPADEQSADLAQHIPTYETVLELDPDTITGTGYELKGDLPCIFVKVLGALDGYEDSYWVSVDNGLLVCAESYENGQLIYRMTAFAPIQSISPGTTEPFALPDGTVIHTP